MAATCKFKTFVWRISWADDGGKCYWCDATFSESVSFINKDAGEEKMGAYKKQQSLYKARVTILGFGKIGISLGRLLKPFGCKITGIKRTAISSPDYFDEEDEILTRDKWESALPETDHLICALPSGPETYEILQATHFKNMPKTSFFYNVGRGNIYKESDLVEALQGGEIAGAYLDVFVKEPLSEFSRLWGLGNVLIQPHTSAASPQYLELFVEELAGRVSEG
jgi:phosphoglycerate dehydrogenase-like enzyme